MAGKTTDDREAMKKLVTATSRFRRGEALMTKASREIDDALKPLLAGATEEDLLHLVMILPARYKHIERIYGMLLKEESIAREQRNPTKPKKC